LQFSAATHILYCDNVSQPVNFVLSFVNYPVLIVYPSPFHPTGTDPGKPSMSQNNHFNGTGALPAGMIVVGCLCTSLRRHKICGDQLGGGS
jgi:hypothetical protein